MKAAVELGLTVVVATVKTPRSQITSTDVRQKLREAGLEGYVEILEDYISPTGRAADLLREFPEDFPPNLPPVGGCADAGSILSVHPNGDVAFCCGHIINDPESAWFTRVGNIAKEPLWQIVDRIHRNVLIWHIKLKGPHDLLRRLGAEEEVIHMCQACHLLATKYWDKLAAWAQRKEDWAKELFQFNVKVRV